MRKLSSSLLIRVPPALPTAVAEAARVEGIGKSEFTRRVSANALAERGGMRAWPSPYG